MRIRTAPLVILLMSLVPPVVGGQSPDTGTRLKDIASLQGTNPTMVVGYGLVAGLKKTGDRRTTIFSAQTLANMLERFGVSVPAPQIMVENVAAVLVTARNRAERAKEEMARFGIEAKTPRSSGA